MKSLQDAVRLETKQLNSAHKVRTNQQNLLKVQAAQPLVIQTSLDKASLLERHKCNQLAHHERPLTELADQ
jgi:hypothetical protein